MGIEYELFKPDKGERFLLGKGKWNNIFFEKGKTFIIKDLFRDEMVLYRAMLASVAYTFDESTSLSYFKQLAIKLIDWCGTDSIQFHDMESFNEKYWDTSYKSYDDHEKKYPYTGDRHKIPDLKVIRVES
jgi:hypothetical protein